MELSSRWEFHVAGPLHIIMKYPWYKNDYIYSIFLDIKNHCTYKILLNSSWTVVSKYLYVNTEHYWLSLIGSLLIDVNRRAPAKITLAFSQAVCRVEIKAAGTDITVWNVQI